MKQSLNPLELFEGLPTDKPIVVAVSGGSDSIALLHLASVWAKAHRVSLHVVTVDHGLRPEAAAEAGFVSGVSEALHLYHYTLAWEGIKPSTGVSQAARTARYLLMEEFARDTGAPIILLGHTKDDQAETLWMRNARDGGNPQRRGMAGMARSMLLPTGIEVIRPLLNCGRQELREHLAEIGQTWVEDPSNFDASYERVRARYAIPKSSISVDQLARFAALNGRMRKLNCEEVGSFLEQYLAIKDGPVYHLNCAAMDNVHHSIQTMIVQCLIAIAGGREFFVSHDQLQQCLALEKSQRMTLGGCVVERKQNQFVIYRENRNLPSLRLEPGDKLFWDGRLLLENKSSDTFMCRAMDKSEISSIETEQDQRFSVHPRSVLQSTPVLFNIKGDRFFPFLEQGLNPTEVTWKPVAPAIEFFCSEYDFALLDIIHLISKRFGSYADHGDGQTDSP